ncbi:MAG: hypothetical protein HQL50_08250 [Magnetococcales bacterium]|nr:hypothetical protein [Magnetococcales bacterium]
MKPVQIRMRRPLTFEETEGARFEGCPHYFTRCLKSGTDYWRCSPECPEYLPPYQRPERPLTPGDLEGVAKLLQALYPDYNLPPDLKPPIEKE